MWQRWGNRQPTIGYPTHFQELDQDYQSYGYDERYLETIPEVESISSRRQSMQINLPELPFRAVPPMTEIPQPVNVYHQPAPITPTPASKAHGLRIDVHVQEQEVGEISPLTPRASQQQHEDGISVSPIENAERLHARAPLPDRTFQNQIPRKLSKPKDPGGTTQTKWDEYSGEPTQDDSGKAAPVRPGSQPVEMQYPHLKERTKQILAGLREREAAKKKPWGRTPPPVAADPLDDPPQRESWNGASGRSALAEPVKNTPSTRTGPKHFPQRNISRQNAYEMENHEPLQRDTSPAAPMLRAVASEESIKPVVPLKTRNLTPEMTTKTPSQSPTQNSLVESSEPAYYQQVTAPGISNSRVESPQYDSEPTTPTTPTAEPQIRKVMYMPEPYIAHDTAREQSRFSWTTYTTSATESPHSTAQVMRASSPPPPIPDLPSPIVIKKRPVSTSPFVHSSPYINQGYADSNSSMGRNLVPSLAPRTSSITSATSRAMSTSKSLPPTPTLKTSPDKMENMGAQLEGLNRRKHNTTRIVADLEASLKRNAVALNTWKRKEVEKNITNHRLELDDIGREIHELSLQLHRAQRKRDRDDGYEQCTGLWIKRVTS